MQDLSPLLETAKLIRYYCLASTTAAGSGHPSSSLSATDLMTTLFFGGHFRFDLNQPKHPNNDRLIFSKGHASPLFYALYAAAGVLSEKELLTLRRFGSPLEGHPTKEFEYTEVATGSLGQGLSVGVGMAINAKYLDKLGYTTYVLLGDSELAEGSNWEACNLASYYKLNNLVAIADINRLGQTGETQHGHDTDAYRKKFEAFGWNTIVIDGHDLKEIDMALVTSRKSPTKPTCIIAKTIKGKGVSFIENKDGWHGRALNETEYKKALLELGEIDFAAHSKIAAIDPKLPVEPKVGAALASHNSQTKLATRKAYGHALNQIFQKHPNMVVLDAEVSNSTFAIDFKEKHPDKFFEMFIAEQNMVGVAVGLAARDKIPFVSTFATFFTRAFDQIRVAQYSRSNINFIGSHAGVSIGEDGPTQMGLEDIALFRSVHNSVVLYPADHTSMEKLMAQVVHQPGICYIRTTRADTESLYLTSDEFVIGGSHTLKKSKQDQVTLISAGITLYEALKAYETLHKQGISCRVIDLYSIKPLDLATLEQAAKETKALITIEDHFPEGGLGEAVTAALSKVDTPIHSLAVNIMPRSGRPDELLEYEQIDSNAIVELVQNVVS